MSWKDDVKRVDLVDILSALKWPGNRRNRWQPCPKCGESHAKHDRKRGCVDILRGGDAYICAHCRHNGDGLDFLARALRGVGWPEAQEEDRKAVRGFCATQLWCAARDGDVAPAWTPPTPVQLGPEYPEGVAEFWAACRSVKTAGPETRAWFNSRGFGTRLDRVEALDLARLTPRDEKAYPAWWPLGWRKWWRFVVRAYDMDGELRSVHVRAVCKGAPKASDGSDMAKVRWPKHPDPDKSYSAAGLCFANPAALALLRGEEHGAQALLLVEGLTDWVSASAWADEREALGRARVAVLGGVSGTWRRLAAIKERVGQLPVICTAHQDPAGNNYALQAEEALGRRLPRLDLGVGADGRRQDVDDFLAAGGDFATVLSAVLGGERPGLRAEVLAWWEQNPRATSAEVGDRFKVKPATLRKWKERVTAPPCDSGAERHSPPVTGPEGVTPPAVTPDPRVAAPPVTAPEGVTPPAVTPDPSSQPPRDTPAERHSAPVTPEPAVTGTSGPRPSLTLLTGREEQRQGPPPPEPPADPVEDLNRRLAKMELAAQAVSARSQLTRLAGEILLDAELIRGLAQARRKADPRLDQALFRFKAIPGQVAHARELADRIAAAASTLADEEVQDSAAGVLLLSEALIGLPLNGLPGGLIVPFPYGVSVGGVVIHQELPDGRTQRRRVLARPLIVVALAEQEGGQAWATLRWWTGARWEERTVELSIALHRGRIIDIQGLGVSTESARATVRYLEAFIDANRSRLPTHAASQQLGWQPDGTFLWGRTSITAMGQRPSEGFTAPEGMASLVAAFKARGSWDGWIETLRGVAQHPRVMLALYASLVPPLLRFIPDAQNFVVDWAGATSKGKTTALKVAASAWGCASADKGVWRSWGATTTFIERMAALCCDLPVALDDTKRARDPRFIARVVYMLSGGQGDGRATVGGVQEGTSWRTVLLSTGEQPATAYGQNGGAEARAVVLYGNPLPEGSGDLIASLERGLAAHYGHLGPRLVELLQQPGVEERIANLYETGRRWWAETAHGDSVLTRIGKYAALLYVAYSLAGELGVPQNEGVWDLIHESAQRQAGRADQAHQALEAVWAWAVARRASFFCLALAKRVPNDGWLGAWEEEGWQSVAILPERLRAALAELGHDTEGVLEEWGRRGWLQRNGRHLTDRVRIGVHGARVRAYVLPRSVLEDVLDLAE